MYRTFIKLSEQEHLFLRQLQSVIRKTTGKKATLSSVIQGVVRDYRQTLEQGADPDFLSVYRKVASRTRFS